MTRNARVLVILGVLGLATWLAGCDLGPGDVPARLTVALVNGDTEITVGDSARLEWAVLATNGADITDRYEVSEFVMASGDTAVATVRPSLTRAYVDAIATGDTYIEVRLPGAGLASFVAFTVVP